MQVLRAETLEGRAVTLRSGLLPRRMAEVGVVGVAGLLLPTMAVLEVASGQKGLRSASRLYTARAEGVMVSHQQA